MSRVNRKNKQLRNRKCHLIPQISLKLTGGTRRRLPIVDLNDERDDGQSLTLVYSENIIVPPEEDEDPTDDQAPDIDKKEDLEDLDRVIEVHLDDEVYDISVRMICCKHFDGGGHTKKPFCRFKQVTQLVIVYYSLSKIVN